MINLFRKLSNLFVGRLRSEASSPKVIRSEPIARFVNDERDIDKRTNSLKAKRLLPKRNKDGQPETSVCRIQFLSDSKIWDICDEYVDKISPRQTIGYGASPASVVLDSGLNFKADGIPFHEHANIIGWKNDMSSDESQNELKKYWMNQALDMAPNFKITIRKRS